MLEALGEDKSNAVFRESSQAKFNQEKHCRREASELGRKSKCQQIGLFLYPPSFQDLVPLSPLYFLYFSATTLYRITKYLNFLCKIGCHSVTKLPLPLVTV